MNQNANAKMVTKLLFRLLPIQILLAAISAVNGIVSSFFASNYIGVAAMSATRHSATPVDAPKCARRTELVPSR